MRIAVPVLLACTPIVASSALPYAASAQSEPQSQMQRLSYGSDELQAALYWPGQSENAPLVVFVHGGGWSRGDMSTALADATIAHWQSQGYAVTSINYRLVPDATVEQQASDVAAALAYLKRNAGQLGFDADRIALSGHSAGAHLVSLVGTDPRYLEAVGLEMDAVRGVLALDGAGYDVPRQMDQAGRWLRQFYQDAFGSNEARQRALSPFHRAAAPNAPDFLILHVDRRASRSQSEALAEALEEAGTRTQVQRIPGRGMRGHMEINRRMGEPDYPATPIVDAWLERVLR